MRIVGEVPGWVAEAADRAEELFGAGAAARGASYARARWVESVVCDDDGMSIVGTVRGSRPQPYQATLGYRMHQGRPELVSWCTCPVGDSCKHVVAVAITAARAASRGQASGRRQVAAWEALMAGLVDSAPAAQREQVGILLGWTDDTGRRGVVHHAAVLPSVGDDITLTAVRPGAKGKWVKTGVDFGQCRYHTGLTEAQRQAMGAIDSASYAARFRYYSTTITLGSLGPHGVNLLAAAARSGIPLIAPDRTTPIQVHVSGLNAVLDVTRRADDGLAVIPAWRIGGTFYPVTQARRIGQPLSALLILDDRGFHLAAAPDVDSRVLPLVDAGGLTVPADDADRFLSSHYPILARMAEVTSGDGSVAPPVEPDLSIVLTLAAARAGDLDLTWSFVYNGSGEVRIPWTDEDASTLAVRRPDDETRLRQAVTDVVARHLPGLVWLYPPGRPPHPYPRSSVVGMQAVTAVTQLVPALEALDGVRVEIDGVLPDYRKATSAPIVTVGVSGSGETDWFDLDITIEVDGQEVPFRAVFTALALGQDHVLLDSGTWFALDHAEFDRLRALIDEARSLSDREGPLRISRWQAGLWDELAEIGVVAEQSEAWRAAVGGLLDPSTVDPPATPDALRATLRPYQYDGFRWLSYLWDAGLGGILADDMGLGKTVQALAAILRRREIGRLGDPVLVVAPTSVVPMWIDEAAKFAPDLRVVAVRETATRRGEELNDIRARADVVVTSYALARIEAEAYQADQWSAVFLDEAQFVKNPRARTHATIAGLRAHTTIAMTGTPLENSLLDLWSLLALAAPGLFPSLTAFTDTFRKPIENERDTAALQRLQRRTRPLMLRRTKDLVAQDLPPKQEQVMRLELPPAHRRRYDRRLARERTRILGMLDDFQKNRIAIFRSLTVLRQLALAPSLVDDDDAAASIPAAKIDALAAQLAEIAAEGHRALVFSQFTGFLRLVRERLDRDGIGHVYLDGRTRDRAARIETWRTGDAVAFLISLKAGGFGLTLTEADYVYVLDPWWNPAAEAQAVDRAHRIGQDKTVMVYRLIATDTIEEKVLALQERKRDLFSRVVDGGGAVDSVLTSDDIRGLFDA